MRGVKPASWSSRQKSLRGFAKCAPAAADTRPGLMPQNTTERPDARTSGTSLGVGKGVTKSLPTGAILPASLCSGALVPPLGDVLVAAADGNRDLLGRESVGADEVALRAFVPSGPTIDLTREQFVPGERFGEPRVEEPHLTHRHPSGLRRCATVSARGGLDSVGYAASGSLRWSSRSSK